MLTLSCSQWRDDDGFDEAIETAVRPNITGLTNPASQSFTYGYDGLDRLLTSDQTGTTPVEYTFSYDSTGNRTSKKVGTAAVQNYTYPTTNHRLTNVAGTARTLNLSKTRTRTEFVGKV